MGPWEARQVPGDGLAAAGEWRRLPDDVCRALDAGAAEGRDEVAVRYCGQPATVLLQGADTGLLSSYLPSSDRQLSMNVRRVAPAPAPAPAPATAAAPAPPPVRWQWSCVGQWCDYLPEHSALIEAAYQRVQAGEPEAHDLWLDIPPVGRMQVWLRADGPQPMRQYNPATGAAREVRRYVGGAEPPEAPPPVAALASAPTALADERFPWLVGLAEPAPQGMQHPHPLQATLVATEPGDSWTEPLATPVAPAPRAGPPAPVVLPGVPCTDELPADFFRGDSPDDEYWWYERNYSRRQAVAHDLTGPPVQVHYGGPPRAGRGEPAEPQEPGGVVRGSARVPRVAGLRLLRDLLAGKYLLIEKRDRHELWNEHPRPRSEHAEVIAEKVAEMRRSGWVVETAQPPPERRYCSRLFLREKEPPPGEQQKYRLICDFKTFNHQTRRTKTCNPHLQTLLWRMSLPQYQYYCKVDLKDAYHQVTLPEAVRPLTAFRCDGRWYEWHRLPQGAAQASHYFQFFAACVCSHAEARFYGGEPPPRSFSNSGARRLEINAYLDDFLIMAADAPTCRKGYCILRKVLQDLGCQVNEAKCVAEPTPRILYLGFVWDKARLTVDVPQEKVDAALAAAGRTVGLRVTTRDRLQSLRGLLKYLAAVVPELTHAPAVDELTADRVRDRHEPLELSTEALGELRIACKNLEQRRPREWQQAAHWIQLLAVSD